MARYLPDIIKGFFVTVELAILIVIAGLALGLTLAVIRSLGIRPLNWLIIFTVDLFRALPPLVIIVLLYFGLPATGMNLSGFEATWLSLTLVLMSFSEEIFWAGITAVPAANGRQRAPPAWGSCPRCGWWCCPRPCA